MRTREEHLQWCKDRALEYWRRGELLDAVTSMASDLEKHADFKKSTNGYLLLLGGLYVEGNDREGVKRWIEGFR